MAARVIPIEIVSDTVCPWCFVGKRRLEKAIAAAKNRNLPLEFKIKFKPFQLDPTLPKEGVSKIKKYEAKFGPERIQQMIPHMQVVGAAEGIKFSYDGLIANTVDSHRVLEYALQKGAQLELVEELFKDYFERNKNIGDHEVLADAAARVGLDKEEVLAYLKTDQGKHEVEEQIESAYRRRITGVPHFRINGTYSLGGAQDPEAFLEIFEALAKQ
ncbi:thiol oxidoreductase FrnE [Spizellomyces punctatus DAOM BR117]|uniref:Thiol oxidoreductase FrnE n=1 Tax=Spizellomyces punctatus (strain DAOM BR117) TaxID=645134 RepID=A0A0L0H8Y8_SPIPD|nr:thiol oxidoreductase FrnE [Spizellomyces punctatus DAOM BR117]KNC98000.1 thiol oxidoreductase FrnE [Spizellomyces punctatus DAOM BR117]|eukprot:XP_016606040.1 thiol oxidoreductase FrnE [Spizellomyces punctatus DAOM BR117]